MDVLDKYFPQFSSYQKMQFVQLAQLYREWNSRINVVSRKDIDNLEINHLLHSLAIAKFIQFVPQSKVLDVGTGGGLPGIPLAIAFPDVQFHLVDSIRKKIQVVQHICEALDLKNVKATWGRAEDDKNKYDFVVSRAVTSLPVFIPWVQAKISNKQINAIPNGIIYLKGGAFSDELKGLSRADIVSISNFFDEAYFLTKKIVFIDF
jgi:16S rRNA (guanine527-N7)-methyltransferase